MLSLTRIVTLLTGLLFGGLLLCSAEEVIVPPAMASEAGVSSSTGSWWEALVDAPATVPSTTTTTEREIDVEVAEFIDTTWLRPHNSRMTGDMVVALRNWYGIPLPVTLALTACETSLGDPKLGGRLVSYNNFGCIRSGSVNTPWGSLASGTVVVGGKRWWAWPDPWTGMAALGRLLKTGPGGKPGFYLKCIENKDWSAFTGTYYGRSVVGYAAYYRRWLRYYDVFSTKLQGR